jgi:hypothetical protein
LHAIVARTQQHRTQQLDNQVDTDIQPADLVTAAFVKGFPAAVAPETAPLMIKVRKARIAPVRMPNRHPRGFRLYQCVVLLLWFVVVAISPGRTWEVASFDGSILTLD